MESMHMTHGDVEVTALDGRRGRRYMFAHRVLGVTVFKSAEELELMCAAHDLDGLDGDRLDGRVMDLVVEEMAGFRTAGERVHDGAPAMPGPITDGAQVACLRKMRDRYGF